jgi:hypothetical protein
MNWRLAVIPVTLIPIIIIAIQFDIEADDVFAIGVIPFTLAVIAIMAKLGLQGLKLAYIARTFLGPFDSIKRLTAMRVGSEFIKFTTPMFVGAEFAVIYYMTKKGISTSKASWVALLDIVTFNNCRNFSNICRRICCRRCSFGNSCSNYRIVDCIILLVIKAYICTTQSNLISCNYSGKRTWQKIC